MIRGVSENMSMSHQEQEKDTSVEEIINNLIKLQGYYYDIEQGEAYGNQEVGNPESPALESGDKRSGWAQYNRATEEANRLDELIYSNLHGLSGGQKEALKKRITEEKEKGNLGKGFNPLEQVIKRTQSSRKRRKKQTKE